MISVTFLFGRATDVLEDRKRLEGLDGDSNVLALPSRVNTRPLLLLTCAAGLVCAGAALADTIESEVGTEAVGGVGIENTLTGGFIDNSLLWTHVYDPLPEGAEIVRATMQIDLIDADDGTLELYAGENKRGVFIGVAVGIDDGEPGPWRDLQSDPPVGSSDNEIEIGPEHFADLADGTFQVYGRNVGLAFWGSNSALLTIEYTLPLEVAIDVRPYSEDNRVRPDGRGIVPVAVLGSEDLDVVDLDQASLLFGPAGAALSEHGAYMADVNKDGMDDLVGFFRISDTGILEGDTEACMTGALTDGATFESCDMVDTSPPAWREALRGRHHHRHHRGHRHGRHCHGGGGDH